ncbi:MAG: hypothetical protein A2Y18_07310 [Clostridiales bacterium GWD2_32_19]|nr:MAG: hypothetical protein A2Y18_07310 [Clostridiales bacterium GWD2_32_19]
MAEPYIPYAILANESDCSLYLIDLNDYTVFYNLELPYNPVGIDIARKSSGTLSLKDSMIAIISSRANKKFMTVDLGLRTPILKDTEDVNFPITSIRNVNFLYNPTQVRAVGVGTINDPGIASYTISVRNTIYTDSIPGQCVFLSLNEDEYHRLYFFVTDYTSKTLTLFWLHQNGIIEKDHVVDTYTEHPVYVDLAYGCIFVLTEEGTLYGYKYNGSGNISLVTQTTTNNIAHSFTQNSSVQAIYILSEHTIEAFEFNSSTYQLTKVNSFEHGSTVNVPIGIRGIAFSNPAQKLVVSLAPYAKVFDSNGVLLKELDNIEGETKGIAIFEKQGIIEPNEILLATSSDDTLYKIDTNTFDVLSTTALKEHLYPPLNATSIAVPENGTTCVVMGEKGWYTKVFIGAEQPYITFHFMSYVSAHSVKYGKYALLASGGYNENDGIDWIDGYSHVYADVQGVEECNLIYGIFYKTNRIKAYGVYYKGNIGSVYVGEIQNKKIPAEIMVSDSPINITLTPDENFLLVACYTSNKVDIVDISNIENVCIPMYYIPCPPEHKYFGVAHSVLTNEKPQTILYSKVKDKVFVLTKDFVEIYTFDSVAKTLNKVFEFMHYQIINPIYGVNQMTISKDGNRTYILGSGVISVFDTNNGQYIRNITGIDFTSIFIY